MAGKNDESENGGDAVACHDEATSGGDAVDADDKKRKVEMKTEDLAEKIGTDDADVRQSKRLKHDNDADGKNTRFESDHIEKGSENSTGDSKEEGAVDASKQSQSASTTNFSLQEGTNDGETEALDVAECVGPISVKARNESSGTGKDFVPSKEKANDGDDSEADEKSNETEGKAGPIVVHGTVKEPKVADKGKVAPNVTMSAPKEKSTNSKGNPYDSLKYIMVKNDGKPESLIKLVALKSLFAKQLPKMPRAYIARLVFDRRHTSLAILNDDPATKDTDEEVIGAICYRAFEDMRFAEIAFCAVNASHQVKGYGTKLMNLVKQEGARTGIEYFITYADNYAIGYFKKQGFTKNISMPKGRFQGLIKDYDGGTMMECYVHPSIDFTRIPEMLEAQRLFILSRIRLKARSTTVYDPLPKDWSPSLEGISRGNEAAARAMAIPGMVEAGWTMTDLMAATGQGKDLDRAKNALKSELLQIVRKVEEHQSAWPFREPVDTNEVKDYLDIIKEPIDLSTIDKRIRKGDHYKSKKMLYSDLMLMVNNCKLYNDEASTYVQCAVTLEKYITGLFQGVTLTRG